MYHSVREGLPIPITEKIRARGDNYFVDVYRFELDFKESDVQIQTEEALGFKIATLDEIKELAAQGVFLHYDSIKQVFEN